MNSWEHTGTGIADFQKLSSKMLRGSYVILCSETDTYRGMDRRAPLPWGVRDESETIRGNRTCTPLMLCH